MNKSNRNNKPVFKRYPRLGQLINKITKTNTSNNMSFDFYNQLHADIQSCTDGYMEVHIGNIINGNHIDTVNEILHFTFDYYMMEVCILYAKTTDIAMDLMYSLGKLYPNNDIIFYLNKTDGTFTKENYQEIVTKGFKNSKLITFCNYYL